MTRPSSAPHRPAVGLAAAALLACAAAAGAQPSNTAPGRSFTTHYQCSNGRSLAINAHPIRSRAALHLTYVGNRAELKLVAGSGEAHYVSADGRIVWEPLGADQGRLRFDGLLDAPVVCSRADKGGAR